MEEKANKVNYEALGLMCGIECHQQLEGRKLFCECPTLIKEENPDFTFTRRLRAVAGELGKADIAAMQEMQKGKYFLYEAYKDCDCLVEMDETPPRQVNEEALVTTLQVSKLLNARVLDGVQVMRKTVVDGSNTSGFQRTALVAVDGYLDTSNGRVGVPTITLEEDAARTVKNNPEHTVYRLDRLGIPLIELGTTANIASPEHCKEVAEMIGMLIRSTGKAKRGIGTIRQDVNVSIKGGARVEIKGAQELTLLPKLVELEAARQQALILIEKELKNISVQLEIKDVTTIMENAESKIIQKALGNNGVVLGLKLQKCDGILGREIQPGKRFGTECSERAKVIAGVGGIFHSDEELQKYGITEHHATEICSVLECSQGDAFVLVADSREKAEKALKAVADRINEAAQGVPSEVRKANEDGTTSYLRPMPGAARMYPETDIPLIPIPAEFIAKLEVPELIGKKIERYQKLGLGKDLAELTAKSEMPFLFDRCIAQFPKLKPSYIAEVLMTSARTIRRELNIEISPSDEDYTALFIAINKNEITKESVIDILKEKRPVAEIISNYKSISTEEVKEIIEKIIAANPEMPLNALIGKAMQELRGKAPGKLVVDMIKELGGK